MDKKHKSLKLFIRLYFDSIAKKYLDKPIKDGEP